MSLCKTREYFCGSSSIEWMEFVRMVSCRSKALTHRHSCGDFDPFVEASNNAGFPVDWPIRPVRVHAYGAYTEAVCGSCGDNIVTLEARK